MFYGFLIFIYIYIYIYIYTYIHTHESLSNYLAKHLMFFIFPQIDSFIDKAYYKNTSVLIYLILIRLPQSKTNAGTQRKSSSLHGRHNSLRNDLVNLYSLTLSFYISRSYTDKHIILYIYIYIYIYGR